MPVKVLIIGHSFIRRLETYVGQEHIANLGLDPAKCTVRLVGFPGLNIGGLRSALRRQLRWGPDIVIMQIGSNDLSNKIDNVAPHFTKIASEIHEVACMVNGHPTVKQTVVCQMLKRYCRQRSGMSHVEFNERTAAANEFLSVLVSAEEGMVFWPHSELWTAPASLYPDGTHLDYGSGYKRYFRSIRGAIIKSLKKAGLS